MCMTNLLLTKLFMGGREADFTLGYMDLNSQPFQRLHFPIANFKGGLGQNVVACVSEGVLLSEGNPVHFNSSFISFFLYYYYLCVFGR